MAYGRKFRKSKRRFSKSRKSKSGFGNFVSGVGKVAKVATTALSIASKVAAVINTEYKHFDKQTTLSPNTVGLVHHLTNIPEGNDDNERNGRSIRLKNIYLRGEIAMSTATPQNSAVSQYFRYILLIDKECKGVAPTPSDILETVHWNSPLKMNNDYQWMVLKDKLYTLDNAKGRSKAVKIFKKIDAHIKYQGTGATIGDARNNQIFLMVISNESNPDVLPYFNFYSRVRYVDN